MSRFVKSKTQEQLGAHKVGLQSLESGPRVSIERARIDEIAEQLVESNLPQIADFQGESQ